MTHPSSLTTLSSSSGCGCKIQPEILEEILKEVKTGTEFKNLLVGNSRADDASVMRLKEDLLLIQTADFFTPIVDDPYLYGRIAAANSLSDVYAMGGRPVMANALLGWPLDVLPASMASEVLQGAAALCREAEIPLAGGHSIRSTEPIFGLSVTGTCSPNELKTNSGARENDRLYLTKPLGIGILASALKKGMLTPEGYHKLESVAGTLNREGALFGALPYVHAMTDVTGFGLLGHLLEMCKGAGLGAELHTPSIPLIEEAVTLAGRFIMPDNTYRNWNACEKEVTDCPPHLFGLLNDPQTNGGLLVAVAEEASADFENYCKAQHLNLFCIGAFQKTPGIRFAP